MRRDVGFAIAMASCGAALVTGGVDVGSRDRPPTSVRVVAEDGRGNPLTGLVANDFEVLVNGIPRPITSVVVAPSTLTVVLLVDVTASLHVCPSGVAGFPSTAHTGTQGQNLKTVQPTGPIPPAVREFALRGIRPGDRLRVGAIARPPMAADGFTSDAREIRDRWRAIFQLPPVDWLGPSPIWDRVADAVRFFDAEVGRREIVVITDGHAGGNRLGRHDVGDLAARSAVPVSVVAAEAVGQPGIRAPDNVADPTRALRELAAHTGGVYEFDEAIIGPDSIGPPCLTRQQDRALERVLGRLRTAYTLEFEPTVDDGKLHALEILVRRPGVSVSARKAL
jgi:hypothetical protein